MEECNKWGFHPPASDVGVSAQRTQVHIPTAVKPAPFDTDPIKGGSKSGKDYLTVIYDKIVPVLLAAVEVQADQIDALTTRLEELERIVKEKS